MVLLFCAVFCNLATGCSTAPKNAAVAGPNGAWYSVVTAQTPFYHYGPQQSNGPDRQLPKGSLMKVIRSSSGYGQVQLENGESGYVASEDIHPAPPAIAVKKTAPPRSAPPLIVNQVQEERFRINSSDPRLMAPPEPLPETVKHATPSPTPTAHP